MTFTRVFELIKRSVFSKEVFAARYFHYLYFLRKSYFETSEREILPVFLSLLCELDIEQFAEDVLRPQLGEYFLYFSFSKFV